MIELTICAFILLIVHVLLFPYYCMFPFLGEGSECINININIYINIYTVSHLLLSGCICLFATADLDFNTFGVIRTNMHPHSSSFAF